MVNWIEHFSEPRRLFLAWQAADHLRQRYRWAVGELTRQLNGSLTLRYFREGDEFSRLNDGRSYEELKALGFEGYPAFSLKKERHDDGVDDVLARRLPPAVRPDFAAYQSQFRIRPGTDLSLIELLAVTEGKLPSDGFSLVDPLDAGAISVDLMLEVAGYRYYAADVASLMVPGRRVDVLPEPENSHDANAVRFCIEGRTVGYVNRLQANAFQGWLANSSVTAEVERLNGRPAHPRAFIFVRVRPLHAVAA